MAVIITNMDMPKRCCDCDIYDVCYYAITDSTSKHTNCPLKSTEILKRKIASKGNYFPLNDKSEGIQEGLVTALQIIDEYCGGESNEG